MPAGRVFMRHGHVDLQDDAVPMSRMKMRRYSSGWEVPRMQTAGVLKHYNSLLVRTSPTTGSHRVVDNP